MQTRDAALLHSGWLLPMGLMKTVVFAPMAVLAWKNGHSALERQRGAEQRVFSLGCG